MVEIDLLVFGSGSLTRSLVMALAARPQPLLSVMIVGRNETMLDSIVLVARARAASLDGELSITSVACDYTEATLDALFMKVRPRIVLVLASLQSPWKMAPRWRQLVDIVGYGLTLPFQAALADIVFRASQRSHPAGFRVNGCYPDVVNRLLIDRGIAVTGGIGNIAILASVLRSMYRKQTVRVLAHHAHIAGLIRRRWDGLEPPRVWLDGQRLPESECAMLPERLALPADDALNAITGAAAISMLQALAGRSAPWDGHAPGVNGLIGGYPVRADAQGLHPSLPPDVTLEEALALNHGFGRFDGIVIENGHYQLTKTLDEIERATGIRLPASLLSWRSDALEEQIAHLEAFRSALDPIIAS